jgi:hypothetical protein
MDDFRIGPTSPYAAYQDEQGLANSNRKKPKRPKSEFPQDEVLLEHSGASDSETEDNLGAPDFYTPSNRTEEPDSEG